MTILDEINELIDEYAPILSGIYEDRTAGDYTFTGVLASYTADLMSLMSTYPVSPTIPRYDCSTEAAVHEGQPICLQGVMIPSPNGAWVPYAHVRPTEGPAS